MPSTDAQPRAHHAGAEPPPAPRGAATPEAQLEALYREHARAILRYALRRTDPGTADDVVAETFLVAWRRRDAVPADALPWLYAVAGNILRTQHRSARRRLSLTDRLIAEPRPTGSHPSSGAAPDTDHALLRALATLRPIDREAILLTAWEDLDTTRAAAAAGCSAQAFSVRLHRAKKRLAAALEHTQSTDLTSPAHTDPREQA